MFLDKITIRCKAGNGGDGCISFRREMFVPNGGPNGGDGGDGGSIIFTVDTNNTNLSEFRFKRVFKATDGEKGQGSDMYGKKGNDLVIAVPQGTVIRNAKNNKVLADMLDVNDRVVLLKGGLGGRGNAKFATSTRQAPKFSELGIKTEEFELILELKTIADVGLVGFPNVGKSSLLSAVSNAKPKIANYHFTTLAPNIGVVNGYGKSFVMADIPGLISGASEGIGLGLDFLRHIERTRLLIHVVDISGSEGRDPYADYLAINRELAKYGDNVKNLPQIIALNKSDILVDKSKIEEFKSKVNAPVYVISAVAHMGTSELMKAVIDKLQVIPNKVRLEIEEKDIDSKNLTEFYVKKIKNNYFEVGGPLVDKILRGIVIDDFSSNAYFQKRLKDEKIVDKMKEMGIQEGDLVKIGDYELEYQD